MRYHKRPITLFFLIFALLLLDSVEYMNDKTKAGSSLYERLEGIYSIAAVVENFIEQMLFDNTLNANSAIKEKQERFPKADLKFRTTEMECQVDVRLDKS